MSHPSMLEGPSTSLLEPAPTNVDVSLNDDSLAFMIHSCMTPRSVGRVHKPRPLRTPNPVMQAIANVATRAHHIGNKRNSGDIRDALTSTRTPTPTKSKPWKLHYTQRRQRTNAYSRKRYKETAAGTAQLFKCWRRKMCKKHSTTMSLTIDEWLILRNYSSVEKPILWRYDMALPYDVENIYIATARYRAGPYTFVESAVDVLKRYNDVFGSSG